MREIYSESTAYRVGSHTARLPQRQVLCARPPLNAFKALNHLSKSYSNTFTNLGDLKNTAVANL
jgi:hypothetical protein